MDPIAPTKPAQELTPPAPKASNENTPAEKVVAVHPITQPDLTPNKLQVSLDEGAERFVQTISDPETSETLLRYPSETQLAYSRAIMAYLRAQRS